MYYEQIDEDPDFFEDAESELKCSRESLDAPTLYRVSPIDHVNIGEPTECLLEDVRCDEVLAYESPRHCHSSDDSQGTEHRQDLSLVLARSSRVRL